MSRIDEIKERIEHADDPGPWEAMVRLHAKEDVRYLLDRIAKLEVVADASRNAWDSASGDVTSKMIISGPAMMDMLDALAAAVAAKERADKMLERVKRYHEWVKDNWLWHVEANAQVGLYKMLNDMEAYFAAAQDAKPTPQKQEGKMVEVRVKVLVDKNGNYFIEPQREIGPIVMNPRTFWLIATLPVPEEREVVATVDVENAASD